MQHWIKRARRISARTGPALLLSALAGCGAQSSESETESQSPAEPIESTAEPLTACAGAIDSVRYSYPFHHSWESWDMSYQDSPNGLPEYQSGGVMYDYHRCAIDGSANTDGICHTPGFRDYMGSNTSYDAHNGYDNSINPSRLVNEGMGEVYPLGPGTVVNVYNHPKLPSEDVIIVKHPNGYFSRYVHLLAGSPRVREQDTVTRDTVLATIGVAEGHLHFDFHDCDYNPLTDDPNNPKEASYYELYRADKRLLARAPWYDSGPSDVVDLQVSRASAPTPADPDTLRFVAGDTVRLTAWGQYRTGDTIAVQVVDANNAVRVSTPLTRTDLGRWISFTAPAQFTIPSTDISNAWWTARVLVNGVVRHQKPFFVSSSGTPNANGPVQSVPSMVSWATDGMAVFYRGPDSALKMRKWTANIGWSTEVNHGGVILGNPSCVSRGANLVDCFVLGSNSHLYRWASTNGATSGAFTDIYAASVLTDPSATAWSTSGMDVFFRPNATTLSRLSWNGASFTLGSTGPYALTAAPSCVAVDSTHARCYARSGSTNELYEVSFAGGVQSGAPTAVTAGNTTAAAGDDRHVTVAIWPGAGNQAHRIDVTSRTSTGATRRQSRIEYTDGEVAWMPSLVTGATALTVQPSCGVRPGTTLFECFGADTDHNLIKMSWTGTRWNSWAPVASAPGDRFAPTVTALGNDRLDVFYSARPVRAAGLNGLLQRTSTGAVWGAEASLGSENLFAPGCTSTGGTNLDCFVVDTAGSVARRTWNGSFWAPWAVSANNVAASQVTAVSRGANSVDIFYRSPTGNLMTQVLGGSGWANSPVTVGAPPAFGIVDAPGCVVRRGTQIIDCFVRDAINQLAHITRDGAGWGAWSLVPGAQAFSAPSAVSSDASHVDVYYRGPDNSLRHIEAVSGSFGAEETLGGSIASAPSCAFRQSPSRIDCFAQGFGNVAQDVLHYAYQTTLGWFPPRALAMGLANLALNRVATQSSEFPGNPAPASRAVDGIVDGNFNHGSVTHTNNTFDTSGFAWWEVDLGAPRNVDHIQVFNRTDCCSARLDGFLVETRPALGVGWSPVSTTFTQDIGVNGGSQMATIDRTMPAYPGVAIPVKNVARYVRIRLNHVDYLSLAEVMVMGREN